MSTQELLEQRNDLKIDIHSILEKERYDTEQRLTTWNFELLPDLKEAYPNAYYLISLYQKIEHIPELSTYFITYLIDQYNNSYNTESKWAHTDEYIGNKALIYFVLSHLGYTDTLINFLTTHNINSCLFMLREGLDSKIFSFNKQQLYDLTNKLQHIRTGFFFEEVLGKLIAQKYELVIGGIKSVNIEINQDKRQVIEKISYLGFNEEYNELLEEIDDHINSDSKSISAGMIGNFRELLGRMTMELGKKLSKLTNETLEKPSEKKTFMKICREFISKHLELSDEDDDFIDAYVEILHGEGGHAFVSEKEYFRLSRNMGIEIMLFLLTKYEKLKTRLEKGE